MPIFWLTYLGEEGLLPKITGWKKGARHAIQRKGTLQRQLKRGWGRNHPGGEAKAQGRGKHRGDGREQRSKAMPGPAKTLGRCLPFLRHCLLHGLQMSRPSLHQCIHGSSFPQLTRNALALKAVHDLCPALTVCL